MRKRYQTSNNIVKKRAAEIKRDKLDDVVVCMVSHML